MTSTGKGGGTMKLLIKQRVFSWTDTYDIYDEDGKPKYFVKAELFRLGHQLHVYDSANREIGMVKQRIFTFLPVFDIEIDGQTFGSIEKQFTFSSPNTIWTIMDGAVKGIFCHGTTMCIPAAA